MNETLVLARPEIKAPGCYGHASVFKHTSPICKACPSFGACEGVVAVKLKSISKRVNIGDFVKRHDNESMKAGIPLVHEAQDTLDARKQIKRQQPVKIVKRELTDKEQEILAILPKKVIAIGKQLIDAHLDKTALSSLLKGSNPFPYNGKRFLHIACNMLMEGGFTRGELKKAYMTNGMSDGTAAAHVSMAVALFNAFSIASETEKVFKLNRGTNQ